MVVVVVTLLLSIIGFWLRLEKGVDNLFAGQVLIEAKDARHDCIKPKN
jgi:hypothetical protein